jgi:hypothetical protein
MYLPYSIIFSLLLPTYPLILSAILGTKRVIKQS